jgi:23S rRNA pseudouridine1911/1915/1917 synthase
VTLETGKTHQIRIHLAERGHPLVGEEVYIRDMNNAGGKPIASPRLMLHAATLGFVHPASGGKLVFRAELPPDFTTVVDRLR